MHEDNQIFNTLTLSLPMEVGCPGTWGTRTADPKPKQPEYPRAHPTCNLPTSPACQKKTLSQPTPQHPLQSSGRTVENLLGK